MEQKIGLLKLAANEIKSLRRQNQLMSIRLEMFDNLMQLFNARPARDGVTMHPDVVYDIEKAIAEMEMSRASKERGNHDL